MRSMPLFSLFISLLLFLSCQTTGQPKIITVNSSEKSTDSIPIVISEDYAKMSIKGMTCAIGCAATIEKKLNQTSGVVSATVNFEAETAWIIYDSERMTLEDLSGVVKSVSDAYSVAGIENTDEFFKED